MFLFTSIFLKRDWAPKDLVYDVGKYSFGFEENGTYQIKIMDLDSLDNVTVISTTRNECKSIGYNLVLQNRTNLCNLVDKFINVYNFSSNFTQVNDIINTSATYYILFFNCGNILSGSASPVFSFLFRNPTTHLDMRDLPLLKAKPLILLIYISLIAYVAYNTISHLKLKIKLHRLLIIVVVSSFLATYCRYFELSNLHKSDESKAWTFIYKFMTIIFRTLTCIFLVLASGGWCILSGSLSLRELVLVVASSFFAILFFLITCIELHGYYFALFFLISLLFFGLFTVLFSISAERGLAFIRAQLLMLQDQGQDLEGSPIKHKHNMYKWMNISFRIFLSALVISQIIDEFVITMPNWIAETKADVIILLFLSALVYIFRLRDVDMSGYSSMVGSVETMGIDIEQDGSEQPFDTTQHVEQDEKRYNVLVLFPDHKIRRFAEVLSISDNKK